MAKTGGPSPAVNPALRSAVDKAKSTNTLNNSVARTIKKANNAGKGGHYGGVVYGRHGPGDVVVLIHTLIDNRNRTAINVRVAFTRSGDSLGETGSVNCMFDRRGYVVIKREDHTIEKDDMLEIVLEADGEDIETSPEVFEIYAVSEGFTAVRDTLEQVGYSLAQAGLTMVPQTLLTLGDEQRAQLECLADRLEDDDGVSEVFTSAENP